MLFKRSIVAYEERFSCHEIEEDKKKRTIHEMMHEVQRFEAIEKAKEINAENMIQLAKKSSNNKEVEEVFQQILDSIKAAAKEARFFCEYIYEGTLDMYHLLYVKLKHLGFDVTFKNLIESENLASYKQKLTITWYPSA